jgi:hypothetical protein
MKLLIPLIAYITKSHWWALGLLLRIRVLYYVYSVHCYLHFVIVVNLLPVMVLNVN